MGPGQYPQYTRADIGPDAVGCSIHTRCTSPNVKPYGRVKSGIFHFLSLFHVFLIFLFSMCFCEFFVFL